MLHLCTKRRMQVCFTHTIFAWCLLSKWAYNIASLELDYLYTIWQPDPKLSYIQMNPFFGAVLQDSANNSTPLCYSKNNRWFVNYLCMNLSKRTPSYSTRYSTRGRVTRPRSINFTIRLRLDSCHQLLVFALTMNLESGPRFADICCIILFLFSGLHSS